MPVDTLGGRVYVEWDPQAPVTPYGQLVFFTQFLKTANLFDPWVKECPLSYTSPNAPEVGDVLGTSLLSILSGHQRYTQGIILIKKDVRPMCITHTSWGRRVWCWTWRCSQANRRRLTIACRVCGNWWTSSPKNRARGLFEETALLAMTS